MICCVSMKNTTFIFWIQHKHRLSNIRKGQLLNIFLSFAMPCFTSLLEGWMPSCVSVLVLSINQTAQQVSCVKNRVIRDEFTHLFFLFQSVTVVKTLITLHRFSEKKTSNSSIDYVGYRIKISIIQICIS